MHFEAGKFIPGVILDLSFARAKLGQMILTLVLALNELWNYFVLWHVYDCEIVFEWEIFTPIAKEHYIFIFTALPSDFVLEREKRNFGLVSILAPFKIRWLHLTGDALNFVFY